MIRSITRLKKLISMVDETNVLFTGKELNTLKRLSDETHWKFGDGNLYPDRIYVLEFNNYPYPYSEAMSSVEVKDLVTISPYGGEEIVFISNGKAYSAENVSEIPEWDGCVPIVRKESQHSNIDYFLLESDIKDRLIRENQEEVMLIKEKLDEESEAKAEKVNAQKLAIRKETEEMISLSMGK